MVFPGTLPMSSTDIIPVSTDITDSLILVKIRKASLFKLHVVL